jgi:hypothetical protein
LTGAKGVRGTYEVIVSVVFLMIMYCTIWDIVSSV